MSFCIGDYVKCAMPRENKYWFDGIKMVTTIWPQDIYRYNLNDGYLAYCDADLLPAYITPRRDGYEVEQAASMSDYAIEQEPTFQQRKDALFMQIATSVAETLAKKNHDYGDSFHDAFVKFGDVSTVIRLSDKVARLESLLKADARVVDESIEDTLFDIAGYAILTLSSKRRMRGEF